MENVTTQNWPDVEFEKFKSIPRVFRECVITEKIDGTNAQIYISEDLKIVAAASRSRWIIPSDDNYGFASWVEKNRDELLRLGPGRHYGEWWGSGIQCGYGIKEKRFSLFNTSIWSDDAVRPVCCGVVPILYTGPFETDVIREVAEKLKITGSIVSPGFMKPEGIVIFMSQSRILFKYTLDGDGHKTAKK